MSSYAILEHLWYTVILDILPNLCVKESLETQAVSLNPLLHIPQGF